MELVKDADFKNGYRYSIEKNGKKIASLWDNSNELHVILWPETRLLVSTYQKKDVRIEKR